MIKKKVIHHSALAASGGATRVAQLITKGMEENGYEYAHSFEASEKPGEKLISPEEAAVAIPENSIVHLHSSADPTAFLSTLPASVKIVATLHDTQMITGGCSYPLDCPHFAKKCMNPCPRNFPDSERKRQRNIQALIESKVLLVSPSRWLAGLVRNAHKDLKARIIPNGIPWPENPGDKRRARKYLGLHPASKVVLFVAHGGQKAGYKSGPQWADYWSLIKKKTPEAVAFAIGGEKNERNGDFVTIPYVDRDTLTRFMLAADVLAYPTLADNHPLVILEAMANALPAVSYSVGGIVEQITNGENGILIPPYEKDNLADTVSTLLNNRLVAEKLGNAGFHKGRSRFSSTRMVNDYLKLYYRLV